MNRSRRTEKRTLVLAGLLLLALTSSAFAMRPASTTERHQVAAAMHVPASCAAVRISSINHSWARFNSRNLIPRCQLGDGYVVLHPAKDVPYAVGADLHICRR